MVNKNDIGHSWSVDDNVKFIEEEQGLLKNVHEMSVIRCMGLIA